MIDLVVIEDSAIFAMLNDVKFTSEIPCLQNKIEIFKAGPSPCGSCVQKRKARQRQEMAALKSCLGNLSPDKKAVLKKLLDAKKVRIVFVKPDGEIVQLTF